GLTKIQVSLRSQDAPLPADDPNFTKAFWRDAAILGPPTKWGGSRPDGRIPPGTLGFDSSKPKSWPLRYSLVHWAILLEEVPPGKYDLRCRTIDANGIAQPLPRPFPRSGRNSIEQVALSVT